MFLRLLGIYRSACFDILFVSILWTCCSHFFWCCFISFAMFCAPVFPLIHWLFSFRFLWNLIFKYVLKICWENSSFIKIWQEQQVLYMENYVHLWYYLAEFFLEWDMFQTKVVEKMERHILFSITSFFISFFFHFFFFFHTWGDLNPNVQLLTKYMVSLLCVLKCVWLWYYALYGDSTGQWWSEITNFYQEI